MKYIPHPYTLSLSFSLINTIRDLGGIVGSKWKGRRSVVEAFKNGHTPTISSGNKLTDYYTLQFKNVRFKTSQYD